MVLVDTSELYSIVTGGVEILACVKMLRQLFHCFPFTVMIWSAGDVKALLSCGMFHLYMIGSRKFLLYVTD